MKIEKEKKMVYRTNGYVGCLIGIVVLLLIFSLFRFAGWLVFGTPLGLVLIGYFTYRYFKGQKKVADVSQSYNEPNHEFESQDSVIDVDYEEVDSDE